MKEYFEMTGKVIKINDIPDEMYGGTLPVAKNKKSLKRKMIEAEYLEDAPEPVVKISKTSAPTTSVIPPQQEAPEDEDSEALIRKRRHLQTDFEHILHDESGTSSSDSELSSDSSDFDEPTQNLIDFVNKRSAAGSVSLQTDSFSNLAYPIPLQVILPEPVAETVVPAPVQVAESEPSAAATVPTHTLTKTLEKATTSVPKQTDVVNQQQQPEPIKQTTPEQTSTQITTQTQTTSSPQKAIPEPVVETVVPESVQVTESEPSVTITVSEQTKKPINQTAINDQPSSSSTIQTNKPTNPNLLKSEFLESEMMNLNAELQRLVQLRRSSSLTVDYQDRWTTLKARASELLNLVSHKCIKIHEAANLHRINSVHLLEEDPAPLFLAYTPFYHKSEYMTREGMIVKLVREEAQKDIAAAKAREDFSFRSNWNWKLRSNVKKP